MLFLREPAVGSVARHDLSERIRAAVDIEQASWSSSFRRPLVIVPRGHAIDVVGCDVLTVPDFLTRTSTMPAYDRVLCVDALDQAEDADRLLRALRERMLPGGVATFTQRSIGSAAARLDGTAWSGFRSGASLFFDVDTLQNLLIQHDFRDPKVFFDGRLRRGSLRVRALAALLRLVRFAKPAQLIARWIGRLDESIILVCRLNERAQQHRLSVIVPVFNEIGTFDAMMQQLVAKEITGIDIEIVVVESNSRDGSRERVLAYAGHPRVKIVLQDAPKGKGNAVRRGLADATGDIVLFQDADLEYELADYDDLIRPICENRRNFVIGSRHRAAGASWKIREFNGAPILSQVFNLGHVLFLGLLNGIYGQRLADPFSMFKVFRRDCIAGLSFECDRFDFDFEIVIKLLRKGYRPIEVPVNYHSRSIAEGKKVTMVRDPLTWLRALVRFRSSPLYDGSIGS